MEISSPAPACLWLLLSSGSCSLVTPACFRLQLVSGSCLPAPARFWLLLSSSCYPRLHFLFIYPRFCPFSFQVLSFLSSFLYFLNVFVRGSIICFKIPSLFVISDSLYPIFSLLSRPFKKHRNPLKRLILTAF